MLRHDAAGARGSGRLPARANTHHTAWDDLEATGAQLVTDRVVDDGSLITAGGVSSGIDLALWVVERFAGRELADRMATRMEYARTRPRLAGSSSAGEQFGVPDSTDACPSRPSLE